MVTYYYIDLIPMNPSEITLEALNSIILQLAGLLPKLIIALIIWYIGKYFLNLAVVFIRKIDVKKTKVDDKAISMLTVLIDVVGRIILVLVILDYLEIGRTLIAAFTQGVTYAIAIALGLAFGKALEQDAVKVVSNLKKLFKD